MPTSCRQPSQTAPHAFGWEGLRTERYDTRGRDFAALTPCISGLRPRTGSAQGAQSFWRESLTLIEQHLPFGRRKLQAQDRVYLCGDAFDTLYLISSGLFKIVNMAHDGREQAAGLYFKGDWLGFDGIPTGSHGCSAVAMDSGEVWTIRYDALLRVSASVPMVMRVLLAAMSAQLAHNRDTMLSMGTLRADARVADFLLQWAQALAERGLRTDQIRIYMTRAEIGNYLRMTMESVSRALSRMARCGVIEFNETGRRDIRIPDLAALTDFIQSSTELEGQPVQ
jgi:CRP/FNR family transcriptional regulator